jgi:hypothetical protein
VYILTHSIHVVKDDLIIPLALKGIASIFDTRHPTAREIKNCRWITLTSDEEWLPNSDEFKQHEKKCQLLLDNVEIPERNIFSIKSETQQNEMTSFGTGLPLTVKTSAFNTTNPKARESLRNKVAKHLGLVWKPLQGLCKLPLSWLLGSLYIQYIYISLPRWHNYCTLGCLVSMFFSILTPSSLIPIALMDVLWDSYIPMIWMLPSFIPCSKRGKH